MELRKQSVRQLATAVSGEEISAHQLIEDTLNNCHIIDEGLNIFTQIAGIDALEQAKVVDKKIKNGDNLPLAGIPVAVKDDISYGVLPTSYGSSAFKEFYSPSTATVVERLMDAGAIVIGKTNLDDMSLGSSTFSSPIGPTANPRDSKLLAGSAGAAAVAAGLCMLAVESDSGGAVRQGASHCGVMGMRPTVGRISRYGLNTFCSSFGQIGFTAITGESIISALGIVSGFDGRDASTALCKYQSFDPGNVPEIEDIKIGYPVAVFDELDNDQRKVLYQAREAHEAQGFKFVDLELSLLSEALRAYYVIALAETSSNHSRFDGIRFGSAENAGDLEELYSKSRAAILGREARRRSILGTLLLSKGNYDRYYRQALKIWNLVRREFENALANCDFLMLPAVKAPPRPIAEETDFLETWSDDLFCAPVSLSGLPALCLPAGQAGNIPVGLQLVGRPFSEEVLASVGDLLLREIKIFPYWDL